MNRNRLALLAAAFLVPACNQTPEDDFPPDMPMTARPAITYRDPRAAAWRVIEVGGDFRPLVQPVPGGTIEWTTGDVVVEGRGLARGTTPQDALLARRAARVVASRNALLAAAGIPIGPGGTSKNISEGSIRLDAVLRDFQEIRSDFDPATRTATSAVRLPMYGARGVVRLAGVVLRPCGATWNWPTPAARPAEPAAGVIVLDVQGTSFQPVLLPRVVTTDGRCVFEAAELGEDQATWRPAVIYATYKPVPYMSAAPERGDWSEAVVAGGPAGTALAHSLSRTFRGAVLLSGCTVRAERPGEIALSAAAVAYLQTHPELRSLFRAGRVIVVADGPQ